MLNGLIGTLLATYPLLIYFGLGHLPPEVFAFAIAGLFAARFLLARRITGAADQRSWGLILTVVMLCFATGVWWSNDSGLLLYYPLLINLSLLAVFAWSLRNPPSVIERLARISEPNLPAAAVRYTRGVTKVWCFFFASMAASRDTPRYVGIYRYGPSTMVCCPTC